MPWGPPFLNPTLHRSLLIFPVDEVFGIINYLKTSALNLQTDAIPVFNYYFFKQDELYLQLIVMCVNAGQFQDLEAELMRRREECSELRNVLVSNTEGLKSVAKTNYAPDADLDSINEDGELVLAFEAQKKINR